MTAFDTRISSAGRGAFVRLVLGFFGYAAGRIGGSLQAKGGRLVAPAEGFVVKDKEGPLEAGELERAAAWATKLTGAKAAIQR